MIIVIIRRHWSIIHPRNRIVVIDQSIRGRYVTRNTWIVVIVERCRNIICVASNRSIIIIRRDTSDVSDPVIIMDAIFTALPKSLHYFTLRTSTIKRFARLRVYGSMSMRWWLLNDSIVSTVNLCRSHTSFNVNSISTSIYGNGNTIVLVPSLTTVMFLLALILLLVVTIITNRQCSCRRCCRRSNRFSPCWRRRRSMLVLYCGNPGWIMILYVLIKYRIIRICIPILPSISPPFVLDLRNRSVI